MIARPVVKYKTRSEKALCDLEDVCVQVIGLEGFQKLLPFLVCRIAMQRVCQPYQQTRACMPRVDRKVPAARRIDLPARQPGTARWIESTHRPSFRAVENHNVDKGRLLGLFLRASGNR